VIRPRTVRCDGKSSQWRTSPLEQARGSLDIRVIISACLSENLSDDHPYILPADSARVSGQGLMFPSPRSKHWRASNFDRRVLGPAYIAAGWRDAEGNSDWTWRSLWHVFFTTALFSWEMSDEDVAAMVGHASSRITRDCAVRKDCWHTRTRPRRYRRLGESGSRAAPGDRDRIAVAT